jgi:hypothetical protein
MFGFATVLACVSTGFAAMSIVFAVINDGKSDDDKSSSLHPSIWREFAKNPVTAA